MVNQPPAVLAGTYVIAYARVDDSVTFVQRHSLAVEGDWLGRVPCLAICEDFKTPGVMVQFCDDAWETIAIAAGYATVDEAKRRTEQSYEGIRAIWQASAISKADALAVHQAELQQESCSFCGRTPLQADLIVGSEAKICNYCIEAFHQSLHTGGLISVDRRNRGPRHRSLRTKTRDPDER